MVAFGKHLQEEESIYGPVTIVNLVEKNGKEKVLGDAYLDSIIRYNSPNISYFSFDFHEWWYVKLVLFALYLFPRVSTQNQIFVLIFLTKPWNAL